jgi:hypothetical protein
MPQSYSGSPNMTELNLILCYIIVAVSINTSVSYVKTEEFMKVGVYNTKLN